MTMGRSPPAPRARPSGAAFRCVLWLSWRVMRRKRNRSPVLAAVLLVLTLVLAVRSLWVSDVVRWRSVDVTDDRSLIQTTFGLRTARLGLGFFYDQAIVSMRNA